MSVWLSLQGDVVEEHVPVVRYAFTFRCTLSSESSRPHHQRTTLADLGADAQTDTTSCGKRFVVFTRDDGEIDIAPEGLYRRTYEYHPAATPA